LEMMEGADVFKVDEGFFVCVKHRQTSSTCVNTNKTHDHDAWVDDS
jgi:hypothetical protein